LGLRKKIRIFINNNNIKTKMKKVFLVLAVMALVAISCKNVETPASVSTVDSTAVQVDSISVDSASLEVPQVDATKTVK
jgi:hypothetical protein